MCFFGGGKSVDVNYERRGTKWSQCLHRLQQGLKPALAILRKDAVNQPKFSQPLMEGRVDWQPLKYRSKEKEAACNERHQ